MVIRSNMRWSGPSGKRPLGFEFLEARLPFAADYYAFAIDYSEIIQDTDVSGGLVAWSPAVPLPLAEETPYLSEVVVDDYFGEIGSAVQPQEDSAIAFTPSVIPVSPTEGDMYYISENTWFDAEPLSFDDNMLLRSSPVEDFVTDDYLAEIITTDVVTGSAQPIEAFTPLGSIVWLGSVHGTASNNTASTAHFREPSLFGTSIASTELPRSGPSVQFPSVDNIPSIVDVTGSMAIDIDSLALGLSSNSNVVALVANSNSMMLQMLSVNDPFRFQIDSILSAEDIGRFNHSRTVFDFDRVDNLARRLNKTESEFAADIRFQSLTEMNARFPFEIDLQGQLPVQRAETHPHRTWRRTSPSDKSTLSPTDAEGGNLVISGLAISTLPQGMLAIGGEIGGQIIWQNRNQDPGLHFVMQATLICEDLNSVPMLVEEAFTEEVAESEQSDANVATSASSMGIILAGCIVIGVQFRFQSTQSQVSDSREESPSLLRKARNWISRVANSLIRR